MYCHVFWPQIESSDESPKYDCNVHGSEQKACVPPNPPPPPPPVPQPPLAEYKKCPTPYQLGTKYDDIGYIVARTYDSQDQEPKCEAPGTNNGPPGGPVDANSLDTQNIISCQRQDVAGAAAAPSRHRCCQLYPRSLSAVFL